MENFSNGIAILLFLCPFVSAADPGLHVIKTFKLGGEGGWDYLEIDSASRHLFLSHGTHVQVIDAANGKVVGKIPLDGKPEFAVSTGAGEIFVNIEDKSELTALDPQTLKVKSTWPLAPCESPSGLAIDVKNRRLFSGCDNKMMAVVNADNGKVIATPPIGDGVDADRFDPDSGFAYASCGEGVLTVVHEDSPEKF